ncbi:hypothetical protein AVEN_131954-1 [Araneus ventricosus]|uniref:Uncharacterized protein n=1 Tax=Araneus ventricosus TaxID=182803 RepID=A0A4Y2B429_ARAVE|nr:hypothetical protein AVEN_131954-1 [Araneus ventricosus]
MVERSLPQLPDPAIYYHLMAAAKNKVPEQLQSWSNFPPKLLLWTFTYDMPEIRSKGTSCMNSFPSFLSNRALYFSFYSGLIGGVSPNNDLARNG